MAGGKGTALTPTGAVTLTSSTITACSAPGGTVVHAKLKCNQGVGNGPEGCDPGNSNQDDHGTAYPFGANSNDEVGGEPGNPGRKGGNSK